MDIIQKCFICLVPDIYFFAMSLSIRYLKDHSTAVKRNTFVYMEVHTLHQTMVKSVY